MSSVNQITEWGLTAVIVGGYLIGMYFQNRRIDDLRDSMNKRFDDMRDLLKSEVKRVEERIDHLDHPIVS
jgi:hypothetical protein